MSKKKRTPKANGQKSSRRRPGPGRWRTGRRQDATSQLRALAGPFQEWFVTAGPGAPQGDEPADLAEARSALSALRDTLGILEAAVGPLDVTTLVAEDLERFLYDVLPAVDLDGEEEDVVTAMAAVLLVYLSFLDETGRWSGTETALLDCHAVVAELLEERGHDVIEPPRFDLPEIPPSDELAALADLPLVSRMRALATWVGPGRRVTATGALRRADLPSAAALLGISVRTPAGSPAQLGDEPVPELEQPDGPVAQSMWDVRELATCWTAAVESGLLDVGSTAVRPGSGLPLLDDGPVEQRLALLRRVVAAYVVARLLGDRRARDVVAEHVSGATAAVLFRSLLGAPLSTEELREVAGEVLDGSLQFLWEATAERMIAELDELRELGLLVVGDVYDVPDPVKPAIGEALELLGGGPREGSRPEDGAAALQLKITLAGSTPPVWRRVLVPADIRLDQLHDVVQVSFGWEDQHLHQFSVGHPYRADTVYAVPRSDPFGDRSRGPQVVDERRVALRDVAPDVGSKLSYLYDFGDDWLHEISVEKVLDAVDQPLPACLAGRGMAPHEDSGGVHGWAHVVAAAADPDDPAHEHMRDWLGLAPGQDLDPRTFDPAPVRAALSRLRR